MAESTHRVEVHRIEAIEPHPNADTLGIVKIKGYHCCVRLGEFKPGDLVAYIQPDSVVDTARPEFSWLGTHRRITVKKLRGVISQGLLIAAPNGANVGDDVAAYFGVTHYEPVGAVSTGGDSEPAPDGYHPVYDVESYYNYPNLLQQGERVVATEKIHGASGRWLYQNDRLWAGSRTTWKRYDPNNLWWKAMEQEEEIVPFLLNHPGVTVYGEVYGNVQSLKYGVMPGQYHIAVFDILVGDQWLSWKEAHNLGRGLPWAPIIAYDQPWGPDIIALADGQSTVDGANHIREGIVVKPMVERTCAEIGRVQLKIVSNDYLSKGK